MSDGHELEPLLEAGEIQGNILGGFNKDLQCFIFLVMPVGDAGLKRVRDWLAACARRITWLHEVASFKRAFRALSTAQRGVDVSTLAPATWMNIALSHPALLRLTPEAKLFEPVFGDGMPSAVGRLGDPLDPGVRGHVGQWLFGGPGRVPDVLLIVAADKEDELAERVRSELALSEAAGLSVMHIDQGRDLGRAQIEPRFPSGREHFGFKDGVSQPTVRGRLSPAPNDYLSPRMPSAASADSGPEFSAPGSPLVCPGEFVLGYPRQSVADARAAAAPWPLLTEATDGSTGQGPPWARNGSFLVYRRLNQDVPAFNRFLTEATHILQTRPSFVGLDAARLGAMVVGRWRSGAPLLRTPAVDNERLAAVAGSNNDFDYADDANPGDGFPGSIGDPEGLVCPAAAHIRKVNPRVLNTDQGGPAATLTRRILRRGIPFGEPLPIGTDADPANGDRGLLFVCYQASIRDQFEFLQASWANEESKPTPQLTGKAGHDLVIGQGPGKSRARYMKFGPDQDRIDAPVGVEWVFPSAGGYFFSPSRHALEFVLGRVAAAPRRRKSSPK
jgi:Dyp-type peroxidase family